MKRKLSLSVVLLLVFSSISVKSFAQENNNLSISDKKFYKWEKPQFQKIDFLEIEKKQNNDKGYLIQLDVLKEMLKNDFKTLKSMFKELKQKEKELDKGGLKDKEDFYENDYKILENQIKQLEEEREKILEEKKELTKNPKGLSTNDVQVLANNLATRLAKNESEMKNCSIKRKEIEQNLLKIKHQEDLLDLRKLELKERKLVLKKYEADLEYCEDMIKIKKKFIKKQMKTKLL